MIPAPDYAGSSAHLLYPDREAVIRALARLDLAVEKPLPVWPPRPLPPGFILSPERGGWVSLWSPFPDQDDWLDSLSGLLECAAISLHLVEDAYFIANFYRHGNCIAAAGSPPERARAGFLADQAAGELMAENSDYTDEQLLDHMEELAADDRWQAELEAYDRLWPDSNRIRPFLQDEAGTSTVLDLLRAASAADPHDNEGFNAVEQALDRFARSLGIRDATWFPQEDWAVLAEGDYDECDGLPEEWREFVILPSRRLPVF